MCVESEKGLRKNKHECHLFMGTETCALVAKQNVIDFRSGKGLALFLEDGGKGIEMTSEVKGQYLILFSIIRRGLLLGFLKCHIVLLK